MDRSLVYSSGFSNYLARTGARYICPRPPSAQSLSFWECDFHLIKSNFLASRLTDLTLPIRLKVFWKRSVGMTRQTCVISMSATQHPPSTSRMMINYFLINFLLYRSTDVCASEYQTTGGGPLLRFH